MKCNRVIPEGCFTCPYADCINNSVPARGEKQYLQMATNGMDVSVKEGKEGDRTEYWHEYFKKLSEEKKARKRQKNREYYRAHRADINEKRRAYYREYARKRREAMAYEAI